MKRQKSKRNIQPAPIYLLCPTPQKIKWRSEKLAKTVAEERTKAGGVELEVYMCVCARWHLRQVEKQRRTHERLQAQIRRKYWGEA